MRRITGILRIKVENTDSSFSENKCSSIKKILLKFLKFCFVFNRCKNQLLFILKIKLAIFTNNFDCLVTVHESHCT